MSFSTQYQLLSTLSKISQCRICRSVLRCSSVSSPCLNSVSIITLCSCSFDFTMLFQSMVSSFKKTPPWYRYEPRVLSYAIKIKGISGRNRLFRHSPAVPLHYTGEYGRGSPSSPCGVVRKYHYPPCVSSRLPCQGKVNGSRLSLRLLPSLRRSICRLLI